METLLARQLQQAWLETQVRKQTSDLSSPSPIHDPVRSSSSYQVSSLSSMSPDPGGETSPMSAPQNQPQNLDEEDFHDPIVHYINDMLMNEGDLEDRKCMMAECMSHFTTLKGFYDILGSEFPPCASQKGPGLEDTVDYSSFDGFACKDEPSPLIDGHGPEVSSLLDSPAHGDDDYLRSIPDGDVHREVLTMDDGFSRVPVYPQATEPLKLFTKDGYHVRVPAHEAEGVLSLSGDEHHWIDDLFNNMDEITPQQHAPAGMIPSLPASGTFNPGRFDSGAGYISSQHSLDSSSLHGWEPLKLDLSSPSSVLTGSTTLNSQWNNDKVQHARDGNVVASVFKEKESSWSHSSEKSFRTLSSSGSTNSRFKRAAPELDAVVVAHSISSISSANNSAMLDAMREESISYVRNEDLNAEKCASILNDGLGSMNDRCCKSSSVAVREEAGRAAIVVTTVADLNGLLISCAQAVASSNLQRAQEILQEIRQDASPYGSGLQRVAHYFAEALVARLSGTGDRLYSVFTNNSPSAAKMLKAHRLFVEVCPYVKVSHYFANRAIVEAAKGASRLHIVDYGILYGLQWPCLISALAERTGGPPVLRITGIDFPQPGYAYAERVEMTGRRLAEYAKAYGVPFEYHAIASRWETVQPSSLGLRQDEVVVVNSMHRLHHLLDETVLASNPRKTVLSKIKEINPKIFVQGIKNGNYNAPFFMSRFKEALACFSGHFDVLEALIKADNQERMMIEREVLGRDILNVIACEGPEWVERPETYRQWQNRTQRAGFTQIPLDRKVLNESQSIVRCSYNKNFTVDEDGSWMLLSWKGKVANALSLWKPAKG